MAQSSGEKAYAEALKRIEKADKTGATVMDLMDLELETLPPEIQGLSNLVELYLQNNNLTTLPPEIQGLSNLVELYLQNNNLTTLPPEIQGLSNLVELSLQNNNLTTLPPEIQGLAALKLLDLSDNNLTTLPPEITDLSELQLISLDNSGLTKLPLGIEKLTKLKFVDCRNISSIELPNSLGCLLKLSSTNIYYNQQNPVPLEIAEKGIFEVYHYINSLGQNSKQINEAKLLFVGDGGAGKTSLSKQLRGEPYDKDESQTHGINIDSWPFKVGKEEISLRLWDFGGQETQHQTHQFFLSERSLYVLVLDGRKEENPEYWLKHIESFGGDSPVLVVLNKIEEHHAYDVNRRFLREKYPSIVGFYPISCKKGTGLDELKAGLVQAINEVEITSTIWPNSWFKVKTALEELPEPHIDQAKYQEICENNSVKDDAVRNTLVDFLRDLGVVSHFKSFRLQDMFILNPHWLTVAVYRIITSKQLAKGYGIISLNELPDILKKKKGDRFNYPVKCHRYIIDLMEKFELCYLMEEDHILVPGLLEIQEPEFEIDTTNALRFRIDYNEFMPKSVIPRFIVNKHQDIVDNLRWRTGVVIEDRDYKATAIIRADESAKHIDIIVIGERKKDYLKVIWAVLRQINDSFEKLDYTENIHLPDQPKVVVSYENLIQHENAGLVQMVPAGTTKPYDVKELIKQVREVEKEETQQEMLVMLEKIINKNDDETSAEKKVIDFIGMKINIFGFTIDVKGMVNLILERIKHRHNKKK
ncbi:MAG: leucine-rich repeat domain-containing protein [Magnetococcales bacterium]|nr:leucine-rich repeat domain-containing protein [Magnetococcales bacterium]